MEENKNTLPVNFISMAKQEQPVFLPVDRLEYVPAGVDNMLFDNLIEYSNYSGIHHAILQTKINLVKGSKIEIVKGENKPNQNETWEQLIEKLSGDLEIVGAYAVEVLPYSVGGKKMLNINHIPIQYLRYQKIGTDAVNSTGMWYSKDWTNTRKYKPVFIPFYNANSKEKRQVYLVKKYWPGNSYTILPSYFAAINEIKTAQKISLFHLSNIENGMILGLIINIFGKQYQDPDKANSMIKALQNKYKGPEKAGSLLVTFSDDKDTATEVKQLENADVDKMFDILAESTRDAILTAHQVPNQKLVGVRVPGELGGSGTELLQSFELFMNMTITPDQKLILQLNTLLADFGTEIKIINENSTFKFAFSESLIQSVLTKKELRKLMGFPAEPEEEDKDDINTNNNE